MTQDTGPRNDRPRARRDNRIASLKADQAAMRRTCQEGTANYARALLAGGYRLDHGNGGKA